MVYATSVRDELSYSILYMHNTIFLADYISRK